ncbi:MAG TPA: hypothetical protein VNI57_15600, partial [Candidatus Saccharimonadales bacterium]|nr:hypothetical protein [Candidatus Saccharimonadales bacterium]
MSSSGSPPFESHLGPLSDAVRERLRQFTASNFAARLWKRDATLWKGDDARQKVVANRLGWLGSVGAMQSSAGSLQDFAREALAEGLDTAVLLGMGGSSLCPEVFATIFGGRDRRMNLIVLDTTDPGAILTAEESIRLDRSLFIVSSKSGSTIETLSLHAHFMERLRSAGVPDPGRHFVAITDPGSQLQEIATAEGFRRCFLNPADIGGRYSALSFFGLVPAALLGMDIPRLLDRASKMSAACGPGSLPEENPGVRLGAILGEAALQGRDKLTFLLSPEIEPFGFWVEQLIAESTGKEGHGILPVEGEPAGKPPVWGQDRLVVYLRLAGSGRSPADAAAAAFREAAHPLVRLDLEDRYDLGGEFLRWEIATAAAGAVLGLNPFDEPNVKESKDNTARILRTVEEGGALPELQPVETDGPLEIYADPSLAGALQAERERRDWPRNTAGLLAALTADSPPGDYVAMMAWLERR